MKTWTSTELQQITGGTLKGNEFWETKGFSLDSRDILPGSLYIAIKGAVHDGHEHVNQAFMEGAVAALVEYVPAGLNGPVLAVPDVVEALSKLGKYQRQRLQGKVIGVTGSAGKTTLKELLNFLLSKQGKTAATPKSFNTKFGVPISIALCEDDTQYAIFEIGMSKAGEIAGLVQQVKPHIAIITTIAAAHLAQFGTLEKIAEAKAEIFQGMGPQGIAIINGDVPQTALLKTRAQDCGVEKIITFGESTDADVRLMEYRLGDDFNQVKADIFGIPVSFQLYPKGKHWAMNAIAALTAIHCAGGNIETAARDISNFKALGGRGVEIKLHQDILLVDESYNANYTSMKAGLESFFERKVSGRRLLVLGSMAELGDASQEKHGELGRLIATFSADQIFLYGTEMAPAFEALKNTLQGDYADKLQIVYDTSMDALLSHVLEAVMPHDAIMVKASRSMELDKVVQAIQQKFGIIS